MTTRPSDLREGMPVAPRTAGPQAPVNARPGVGFSSLEAYLLASEPTGDAVAGTTWEIRRFDEPLRVEAGDELAWVLFPESAADDERRWESTYAAVDLELDDGSLLSATGATDQYGARIAAAAQGEAKRLWVDQWNLRRVSLAGIAGRRVRRIVATVRPSASLPLRVFLDDVAIRPAPSAPATPLDAVVTTRGTHSSDTFSRGNNAPLVGLPHGGVFGLPMTDASRGNWPYSYHADNRAQDNRPALQAFATSHLPSPWMGDRGVFQVMPSPLTDPDDDRAARALAFDRADESPGPHRYAVDLDGGVSVEMVPGEFALGFRFGFAGAAGSLILDHHGTMRDVRVRTEGETTVVEGLLLDDRDGFPPHHVHLRVPGVIEDRHRIEPGPGGDRLRGHLVVDAQLPVDVHLGLSTISAEQAVANVAVEGSYDAMAARARDAWERALATVRVEGATPDQLVSLYSGLYRVLLYPNHYAETAGRERPAYRSPYLLDRIGTGPFTTTHGFWDTYRTAWPLLALLDPDTAGELAEGFVQHFRDGGWTPRWSAPGAQDCMTGTTFDAVLGDLALREVPGIDLETGYQSVLRNATVPSDDARVGRKGLRRGIFRGYIDTDTHEGLSWTLDNAINDWGAARLAGVLAERVATGSTTGPDPEALAAEQEYFARRALWYRNVFDAERGFFIGRTPTGDWRAESDFDPDVWGHDYTETNAWGTRFTAPHDGAGLVELYGGDDAFAAAFEEFYARPETGDVRFCGHYGFAIHEMTEARDIRMGMLGLSNQPAHHIPFMPMFAGRHDDAHRVVRECLDRLFVGSDLGQGYPGDEDNGEMSAWYILAAIGLYPLAPGSAAYVLVPPLFRRVEIAPPGRPRILIETVGDGCYVAGLTVDGEPWEEISIPHARLAAGAHLVFELAATPRGWARDSRPPSASLISSYRTPITDATAPGAGPLVDDTGETEVSLAAGESVVIPLRSAVRLSLYTVTAGRPGELGWRLDYLDDTGAVVASEERVTERFIWAGQTRPFRVCRGAETPVVAASVRFTATTRCVLTQLELIPADRPTPKGS